MKVKALTIALYCLLDPCSTYTFKTNDLHRFFWANYLQYAGDYDKADTWYQQSLEQTSNPYIYKGYIPLLFETNKFRDIVQLMPSLDKKFEHDVEIQQLFAQALLKTGKQQAADDRFIRLNNQFKSDQAIAFQTANIYMARKEPENAIATIDNLLNCSPKKPNNFIFHFLKSQIYVQMNNKKNALESIKTCLAMAPTFDKAWLLFALLEEQAGSLTEAIKGYTNFLEMSDTNHHDIQQHLLQLTFNQKIAQQHTSALATNQSSFMQALRSFEQKEYTTALAQIEQCLEKNPQDPESRLLKIQILTALKQHAQAADTLKGWILGDTNNEEWFQTLYLLYKNGLSEQKAIAILEDITQAQPTNITPILYLADLTTRIKHLDTALIYYKKATSLTNQARLKTKLLYQMALIYHEQRKFNDMEKVLQEGYDLGLEFPPLMNLLAYHYAKSDKNIDVAHNLINKAIAMYESNPHFLDTQALIWYKQQQFDKAVDVLHTVIQELPHDFSALTTLGKSYYKMGKKELALQTIQKAHSAAQCDDEKEQCKKLLFTWNMHHHD